MSPEFFFLIIGTCTILYLCWKSDPFGVQSLAIGIQLSGIQDLCLIVNVDDTLPESSRIHKETTEGITRRLHARGLHVVPQFTRAASLYRCSGTLVVELHEKRVAPLQRSLVTASFKLYRPAESGDPGMYLAWAKSKHRLAPFSHSTARVERVTKNVLYDFLENIRSTNRLHHVGV